MPIKQTAVMDSHGRSEDNRTASACCLMVQTSCCRSLW